MKHAPRASRVVSSSRSCLTPRSICATAVSAVPPAALRAVILSNPQAQRSQSRGASRIAYIGARAGYLLLEVVLALGLLILGMAIIGMQIQDAFEAAHDSHRMLRAINLAESKISELDAGLIIDLDEAVDDDLEHEFGRLFPNYGWRIRLEPLQDTPELWALRLDILFQYREDVEEEFDFDEAEIVFTTRTLRTNPPTIDPQRDFGADEDALENLTEALAGTDIDPNNIDLRLIGGMPLDQLLGMLTALQEAGVLQGVDLSSVIPPEIMDMLTDGGLDLGDLGGDSTGAPEGQ